MAIGPPGRRAPRRCLCLLRCASLALVLALPLPPSTAAPGTLPRRALWIEVSANLRALSTVEGIRAIVARAQAAGFDTLIPEAKNAWGFVLYDSAFAPHIRTSRLPRAGYPPPAAWYPADHDALAVLVREAHAAGLRVHVAVNAFGEGLTWTGQGPALERPGWQAVHVQPGPDGTRLVPAAEAGEAIVFANPAHPEVQLYELAVIWEVLSRYPLDGLVLDRARYPDLTADFSDLSRARFEAATGRPVARWPDEVLTWQAGPSVDPSGVRLTPGPRFAEWVAWRAGVIAAFVRAARALARALRPDIPLGYYVGAWYPEAYRTGQNWGSGAAARPAGRTDWWSPAWEAATLLPHLDYVLAGLYYRAVSPWEARPQGSAWWRSVTGGARLARAVAGQVPVIGSVWLDLYRDDPAAGAAALRAALRHTAGLMVFDLSDVEAGGWWERLRAVAGIVPTGHPEAGPAAPSPDHR